jgi:HEAT repeat protein
LVEDANSLSDEFASPRKDARSRGEGEEIVRPEALLKSALEKIVYFEARSQQLENDLHAVRSEADRLRNDIGGAAQREIELRRMVAELEVRANRAHAEREDSARVVESLRRERAELIGKMLEASRIHKSDEVPDPDSFDLARFISELRGEVLYRRAEAKGAQAQAAAVKIEEPAPAPAASAVTAMANELKSQGRLQMQSSDYSALSTAQAFAGRTEETLFGFSVRELSAPDSQSRIRAAERLKALGHPAAAPALATALHGESDPLVQVALLASFSHFAKEQGVPVVAPLLTSAFPDVRISALKALLTLDPTQAGPHLTAAMSDPDRAVRRRASLLALSLTGEAALQLGQKAIADTDSQVRSLAALVLGASGAEAARPWLFRAMRDPEEKVRRAASESLSKLLGRDVSGVVGMEDAPRRRAVRQLAHLPNQPAADGPSARSALVGAPSRAKVAVLEVDAAPAKPRVDEKLCGALLIELRSAIRGRTLAELTQHLTHAEETTLLACRLLEGRGQVVRRGSKYFVA